MRVLSVLCTQVKEWFVNVGQQFQTFEVGRGVVCEMDLWSITNNPFKLGNIYLSCGLIQPYFLPNTDIDHKWQAAILQCHTGLSCKSTNLLSGDIQVFLLPLCLNSCTVSTLKWPTSWVDISSKGPDQFCSTIPCSLVTSSVQILFCSHENCDVWIAIKFCTCHNSIAVVTCAKFCSNLMVNYWTTTEYFSIEFEFRMKSHGWNVPHWPGVFTEGLLSQWPSSDYTKLKF